MDIETRKLRIIRERIEAHLREVFGLDVYCDASGPASGVRAGAYGLEPSARDSGVPSTAQPTGDKHQDQFCSDCAWGYECARTGVCQRRAQGELRSVYGRGPLPSQGIRDAALSPQRGVPSRSGGQIT